MPQKVCEWEQTQHTHQSVPEVCWLVIDTNAPDVAPISYPNSSPPMAGNRNTRDVMSQSTSRGVKAAADMSVCGASCNSKETLFEHTGKVTLLDQCCKVPPFRVTLTFIVGVFASRNCVELTSKLSRSSARTSVSRRAVGLMSGMLVVRALDRW